jgi:uncharacterized damage-inducible protein DinB
MTPRRVADATLTAYSFGMAMKDALLAEYDHEMGTTRRLLDRLPEAELGWKPHDKSMTLGQLAGHIANLPHWCSAILDRTDFDLAAAGTDARPKTPESVAAVLADFDAKVGKARSSLATASDADMAAPWSLKKADFVIFTMPRVGALRSFVMNHIIHHRGQLSVYLRLQNVPLPPIYGPTADES